jgi:hypothetical protein
LQQAAAVTVVQPSRNRQICRILAQAAATGVLQSEIGIPQVQQYNATPPPEGPMLNKDMHNALFCSDMSAFLSNITHGSCLLPVSAGGK